MEDHDHGHGHSHDHAGSWDEWLGRPLLRFVLTGLALVACLTVIGIVALWPDGSGRDDAIDRARTVGLASDRLSATVVSVTDGPCSFSTPDVPTDCRAIVAELTSDGTIIALPELSLDRAGFAPEVSVGDGIVVGYEPASDFYFFADQDRRGPLVWLLVLFAVVVVALGRWRGVLALLSMALTIIILVGFVAPSVLDGNDPLLVSVVAASTIAIVGLYLTHGFGPTTTMALAGTLGSLGLTLAVSQVFFSLTRISGFASEEGLTVPIVAGDISLSSLVLGGAVLGALGALDDVTITQVATVAELKRRSPELGVGQLTASGIRIGRAHIASTVNTLLLAYAGAAMPLLLLFAVSEQSLGTIANGEIIAVEIVRTLCGSIGLVAAVPITTLLTATLLAGGPGGAAEIESDDRTDDRTEDEPPGDGWDAFSPREDG